MIQFFLSQVFHLEVRQEQEKLFGIDKLNIKRSDIPAVTHVDYSARIQTVNIETNPRYFNPGSGLIIIKSSNSRIIFVLLCLLLNIFKMQIVS